MITVVVEGLDFAGKTTVCREVNARLSEASVPVTDSLTCLTGGFVDRLLDLVYRAPRMPSWLRSTVYHLGYVPDLFPALRAGRGRGGVLLQQSYIHRVLAYDRASRRNLLRWAAQQLAGRLAGQVDLFVYLECPLDERRRRYLRSSDPNRRDDLRFSAAQESFEERLEFELRELVGRNGYLVVDNTHGDHRKTAARIVELIEQLTERR
ncbi:hypothetical protein [Streptomyces zingiberis]|uniref:Thymidylate kinase n=1 Tax=Streptomyces zingiberis TaxID=2053010 RepID=A0ABX1BX51_9ACTN|nr:hypothetical protein [Streptomyces zingiberis]NJQ01085.1 hypothetical protein [Streptomyces zingiberis]